MKLVVNIQLKPTPAQRTALLATLHTANAACNFLSERGWTAKVLRQYDLHKLAYHETKAKFGLTAQMVVRSIAKVADAYKISKGAMRRFRKDAAQPYDDHILRFCPNDLASIWTMGGRAKIPYVMGEAQRALFAHRKGEVDLMLVKGKWYLACVCDVDEPALIHARGVLGIDLGIVNLATDSLGESFSGAQVDALRVRYARLRAVLQRAGTKAAKRHLQRVSGKQKRFQKITNHTISKAIVSKAVRLQLGLAVENLTGIRSTVKARTAQRYRLHNWSFEDLRAKIEYKAARAGIPCAAVDPRNTSRTCPKCGHIAKANRRSQALFSCRVCEHTAHADVIGAVNIAARYPVTMPIFAHPIAPGVVESLAL